jgi:hypothetical protein
MEHCVKARVLRMAADMLGGPRKLRDALQVPSATLADWLNGVAEPPPEVVLRAMAMILDDLDAGAPRLRRARLGRKRPT